jgi:hypothetical protein
MRERDEARAELAYRYLTARPAPSTPLVVRHRGEGSGAPGDERPAQRSP